VAASYTIFLSLSNTKVFISDYQNTILISSLKIFTQQQPRKSSLKRMISTSNSSTVCFFASSKIIQIKYKEMRTRFSHNWSLELPIQCSSFPMLSGQRVFRYPGHKSPLGQGTAYNGSWTAVESVWLLSFPFVSPPPGLELHCLKALVLNLNPWPETQKWTERKYLVL